MNFSEMYYVELTFAGKIENIFSKSKEWLKENKFKAKKEESNKSIKAFKKDKKLSRWMRVTFAVTNKGILVSIEDTFESTETRGETFTLRADVGKLLEFLRANFTQVDPKPKKNLPQ